MEQEIEKKIKDLKDFIKQKTDQGTANYLVKEIREICGMVETEALSQHHVITPFFCDSKDCNESKGVLCNGFCVGIADEPKNEL